MVPRDQFNRMAALALAAILLLMTFACRAYAADLHYIDSGFKPWLWEEAQGDPPGDELPEPGEGEDPGESGTLLEEVTQIRQMLEMVLYFVIPFAGAAWLVYKFCMWFYYTFIRAAF